MFMVNRYQSFRLFLYPEDGSSRFFQNFGNDLSHYTGPHHRKYIFVVTTILYNNLEINN
jgi:hypothetical protein